MAKSSKTSAALPPLPPPFHPTRCFVRFSSACLDAGTAAVSLRSLANQLEKHPRNRPIMSIQYNADQQMLELLFMEGV